MKDFQKINRAYNNVFKANQLSIGIVVPIENYSHSSVPTMLDHAKRVRLVESLGFKAIWLRDVPFYVPSFGDAGQTYDPFTYAGYLAGQTSKIAIGVASIALPLHHPIHVAKSAATVDQLSGGRFILGVASGDRYDEYPAMGISYENRGKLFRDAFNYIRKAQEDFPIIEDNLYGVVKGNVNVLPKATVNKIPMLVTGFSQQTLDWNAQNGDGWMYYPRDLFQQEFSIKEWRKKVEEHQEYGKPFMQPLYVDLQKNEDFKPEPIHLGFKIGVNYLVEYLNQLQSIGANHIALNLRFNSLGIEQTLVLLAEKVVSKFHV